MDAGRLAFEALDPLDYPLPAPGRDELATPALCIYLEHVRANIARMLTYVEQRPLRWRPHVKTTKMPRLWAELMDAGLRRFKCATLLEARLLLETLDAKDVAGGDVILAHPLRGPAMDQLGELATRHPRARLSVLVEDPVGAHQAPVNLGLFLDINTGMDRTGIPIADAARLAATRAACEERLRGFHAYDGDRHELPETERQRVAHGIYEQLLEALAPLSSPGLELCTSGTPAFRSALAYEPFRTGDLEHTVSPGTVVLHDLRSQLENPDLGLRPAALVLARAVSHPRADLVTLNAGSKAIGADAGDPCAYVLGRPELIAQAPSEEHLPLQTQGERPAPGELLQLIPRHVCTTVNAANAAILIDGSHCEVVHVAGRGHELPT